MRRWAVVGAWRRPLVVCVACVAMAGTAVAGPPAQDIGTLEVLGHPPLVPKPHAFVMVSALARPEIPLTAIPEAARPAVAKAFALEARFFAELERSAKAHAHDDGPTEAERKLSATLLAAFATAQKAAEAELTGMIDKLGTEALLLLGDMRLEIAGRALDDAPESQVATGPALVAWKRVSATAEPAALRAFVRYREGKTLDPDDVEGAIAAYRTALATDGITPPVRGAVALELGDLLWSRGDPHALDLLAEAVALCQPTYRTAAHFKRMLALKDFGRPVDAMMEGVALLAEPDLDSEMRVEFERALPYDLASTAPSGFAALAGAPEALRARALADAARVLAESGHTTWAELYLKMAGAPEAVPAVDAEAVAAAVNARGSERPEVWARRVLDWCIAKVPEGSQGALAGLAFAVTLVPPSAKQPFASATVGAKTSAGPLTGCFEAPIPPPEGPAKGWTQRPVKARVHIEQAP